MTKKKNIEAYESGVSKMIPIVKDESLTSRQAYSLIAVICKNYLLNSTGTEWQDWVFKGMSKIRSVFTSNLACDSDESGEEISDDRYDEARKLTINWITLNMREESRKKHRFLAGYRDNNIDKQSK